MRLSHYDGAGGEYGGPGLGAGISWMGGGEVLLQPGIGFGALPRGEPKTVEKPEVPPPAAGGTERFHLLGESGDFHGGDGAFTPELVTGLTLLLVEHTRIVGQKEGGAKLPSWV